MDINDREAYCFCLSFDPVTLEVGLLFENFNFVNNFSTGFPWVSCFIIYPLSFEIMRPCFDKCLKRRLA